MAKDYATAPIELLSDDFALCVNATVWFNAREYIDAVKREPAKTEEGLTDLNVPPPPRTVKGIKEARQRQINAFEMIQEKLKQLGAR